MVVAYTSRLEKLYLMILFIISNSTCMKLEETPILPASSNQITYLGESVCSDLFLEKNKVDTCLINFLSHTNMKAATTDLHVACRSSSSASDQSIAFTVTPMERSQLITLVALHNTDDQILNYMLVDPGINYSTISVPMGRYTVWTTVLNGDGSATPWIRGQDVQPWTEVQKNLKQKKYDIKFDFLTGTYKKGTYFIDVRFTWNNSEALDSCFSVTNNCKKKTLGDFFEKDIKPYEERVVIVKDVPLDDDCTFHVSGLYGTTSLSYRTLSCSELECVPKLKPVQNIKLEVTQGPGEYWSVRVSWTRPEGTTRRYNVTLASQHAYHTKIIPGDLTEAMFTNISGDGLYEVSVGAQAPGLVAYNSKQDIFPARVIVRDGGGVPLGVIWMLGFLALTALVFGLTCWRRRFNYKRRNIYLSNELQKIAGEIDTDESSEPRSNDKWEIHSEHLVLHEIIGEGAFGVVRRGTLAPFKDVAVKMLKDFPSVEDIRSFRSEIELMKSVGVHPHIVSLVGCCSGRRPLILVEYCSRGDLLTFLRCSWDVMTSRLNAQNYNNNNKKMDYRVDESKGNQESKLVVNRLYDFQGTCDTEITIIDLLSFCRQIAMGMEFLESNRVVHRDLAARNILVTENRTLKIADFGLSRDVYQENQYKQKGNGKMPVKWMALESLTHRIYTTHSDVWSFGVVMWEVLTVGGAPYASVNAARLPRLLAAGYRMPRPLNCSPELYAVMQSCWQARPRARPSFAQLHAALDEQLCARAGHYMELAVPDLELDTCVPRVHTRSYVRSLTRSTLSWVRSKSYERPQANSNHYTVQPALTRDVPADMKIP